MNNPSSTSSAEIKIPFQISNSTKSPPLGTSYFLQNIDDLELHFGMPDWAIEQILASTKDSAIHSFTSDASRFSTRETLEKWYANEGRYIFTLVSTDKKLAGLWYARKAKPPHIQSVANIPLKALLDAHSDSIHTSGIRVYPGFRGKGLAEKIMRAAGEYYRKIFQNIYMCVDISKENIASRITHEKCGFVYVGEGGNEKSVGVGGEVRMVYVEVGEDFLDGKLAEFIEKEGDFLSIRESELVLKRNGYLM